MVIRTGRGLTIAGTRITLYQILDYLKAGWPPDRIQYLHRLTDDQMADTLRFMEETPVPGTLTILVDHNMEGQAGLLWEAMLASGWLTLLPVRLTTFAQEGLPIWAEVASFFPDGK